jgi:putative tryptophan/tyrosine transport system substrate-binding protein
MFGGWSDYLSRGVAASALALFSLWFLAPAFAQAQQAQRVYRIGYLTGGSAAARVPFLAAFKQGMQERGYVERRNLVLEARFADGKFEQLPSLARELIAQKPDLLFVSTTPASLAAKAATATVPIVFVGVADPLGVGLVQNLARPGANITGITNIVAELTGKRLALLKEIVPRASRIALLINPDDPNASIQIRSARDAAQTLGIQLDPVLNVRRATDLEPAFAAAVRAGASAALRMVDPTTSMLRAQTTEIAAKHRLPVMYPFREDVEAGGLVAYGTSLPDQYRQAATFVDKILRGAKPSDLPIERPTKFDLVVNVKAARALGLAIPPSLLVQAEQISD